MHISDQEHVERCRNGTPDDFRFLVERYQGPVFAYAVTRLHDRTAAREVAQESFVRAFFALPKLKKPEAFHAWVIGITARVALEFQRTDQRRKEVGMNIEPAAAGTAEVEDPFQLEEAIAALPDAQRQLVLLRYFERLSCQQIADRLKMPLGTVTKTLSRAYGELRALLEAQQQDKTPATLEE